MRCVRRPAHHQVGTNVRVYECTSARMVNVQYSTVYSAPSTVHAVLYSGTTQDSTEYYTQRYLTIGTMVVCCGVAVLVAVVCVTLQLPCCRSLGCSSMRDVTAAMLPFTAGRRRNSCHGCHGSAAVHLFRQFSLVVNLHVHTYTNTHTTTHARTHARTHACAQRRTRASPCGQILLYRLKVHCQWRYGG